MAWKASWAHRTGENGEKKRDTDKILKIGPNVERLWFDLYSDIEAVITKKKDDEEEEVDA